MAISKVRVQIDGTWHTLTSTDGKTYTGTITAPGATSYNKEGGYYDVTVEATNTAGSISTQTAAGLAGLKLFVREKVPPVITIISPSAGAYVSNNKQTITFTVVDETGGSGVDFASVAVKVDGVAVSGVGRVSNTQFSYTPPTALSDGNHTVTAKISDNDGNQSAAASTTFKVDTVPPTLNITAPANNFITNNASVTVTGTTNDATASPVTITMTLNGTSLGTVTVATNGSFSKAITLREGSNTIVVTAKDAAGKTSSVTRTATLDTSSPVIKSVSIAPNPVDSGGTIVISVVIE